MPRNMSFFMTKEQVVARQKDVTRRLGWWFLKPGDVVQPVEKGMGLKPGETVVRLGGPVEIVSTRGEPLDTIDKRDCIREGFPELDPEQFVQMLCRHYGCTRDKLVNRIEFRYL